MFNGSDKYNGETIKSGEAGATDISNVLNTSSSNEIIIAQSEDGVYVGFIAKIDIKEGGILWDTTLDVDECYRRTLITSQMTSMLHDERRNSCYEQAIKCAINDYIDKNKSLPVVYDIGCGTGLLSLFSLRNKAEQVISFEQFGYLADIATEIVKENHYEDKITVINGNSTKTSNLDLPKGNILVTEILDSMLLGEGVIPTVRDAQKRFLGKHPIVLPLKSQIYVQLIESEELKAMRHIEDLKIDFSDFFIDGTQSCLGGNKGIPIHSNKIKMSCLSDPILAQTIDLNRPNLSNKTTSKQVKLPVKLQGIVNGVILWWNTEIYNDIYYSTAPDTPWQDHWVQMYYPLPCATVKASDTYQLHILCNDTNIWIQPMNMKDKSIPKCVCNHHVLHNPSRLYMLNSSKRKEILFNITDKVNINSLILDLSDTSYYTLLLLERGYKNIYSLENKQESIDFYSKIGAMKYQICILNGTPIQISRDIFNGEALHAVINEMFYYQMQDSILLSAFNYWYQLNCLKRNDVITNDTIIFPSQAHIMCCVCSFKELYGSFGPVTDVSGFTHGGYNAIYKNWGNVFIPLNMYMYDYTIISNPAELYTINYKDEVPNINVEVEIPILITNEIHGLVLWVNYNYNGMAYSTGLLDNSSFTKEWRQQVKLLDTPFVMNQGDKVKVRFSFNNLTTDYDVIIC